MRNAEALTFLKSFGNDHAREFARKMLKNHYGEAILIHHPKKEKLNPEEVHQNVSIFVDEVFNKIAGIAEQPDQLFPLFTQLSRHASPRDNIWFSTFLDAYNHYKHQNKLKARYHDLLPYLRGNSYCDIGSGGGDLVAYMADHHPSFAECAGIDVLDWRSEAVKEKIDFQMLDLSREGVSSARQYDTLTCLAVLHHVSRRDEDIRIFLDNVKTAMLPGSVLVVEEDVIMPKTDWENSNYYHHQIRKNTHAQPLFAEFVNLSSEDQRDLIILIDFLSNCITGGVPEMAFPCGFKTLTHWLRLFWEQKFTIKEVNIRGFVPGNFNRSCHTFFVLEA